MDNKSEIQRSNMTLVIIGNDEKLISYLQVIVKELPDAQINLLIEDDQFLPHEFKIYNNQHSHLPKMFSKIRYADYKNKTLITKDDGELHYDTLIIFPLSSPSIKIRDTVKNVHYPPFEFTRSLHSPSQNRQTTILYVSDQQGDLQTYDLLSQNIQLKYCKTEDIVELHLFENLITSVTLRDKCVYPVDGVCIASMKYEVPLFIQQTSYTQAQMELMDVYVFDQNEEEKLSQIVTKLKPSGKVLCIKKMELLPECDILDRSQGQRLCHCHDICKIQNIEQPLFSSYFTKNMEAKLTQNKTKPKQEEFLNFDQSEAYTRVIKWIVDAKQTLERRFHMNKLRSPFPPPEELSYIGASSFVPNKALLKKSIKWILDANMYALKELSIKKQIHQRTFSIGLSSIPENSPFILYYGSYHQHIHKLHQSHKEARCGIGIYTMGCSGLELSLSYGWPYLAGFLEQEYCFNHPQCCGIIFEDPCLMNTSFHLVEQRKLPLLDLTLAESEEQILHFFEACKKKSKDKQDSISPRTERKVLLDQGNENELDSFDQWIIIPACCGNWTNTPFIQHIKTYQEQEYAIFACGCSLTTLMNASFYPEYAPISHHRSFFGNGSFTSIQEIAQKVNLKKVKVLLDGILKNDALIDALTLKTNYGFPLLSHDDDVLRQLKCLEPYL